MNKIPRTELQVMKYIWSQDNERVAAADITKFMKEEYDWKQGSTSKVLTRLTEKEFIRPEKEGRKTFYYSLVDSEEYLNFETQDFLEFMHDNSISSMISALNGTKQISDDDIKALEELIKSR